MVLQMQSRMTKQIVALTWSLVAATIVLTAQTAISPPPNKYSPEDDVKLGRDAAEQARQQLPIMRDEAVSSYVSHLGDRLAAAIPNELQHSEFHYTFETVNVREINAFALPGGPMFVNRGMVEAAQTEGEVAGVMAHELSHVVLRHGTAQASKATPYAIGQVAGAVLGAIVGGDVGSVIAQGTQFGIGAAFLRFSRDFERQADIEGSHIMARAGYDPRDMANMFKTIEKQGGSGGPEWLSDHPNPGNRSDYINKEAALLRVENPIHGSGEFEEVRAHLRTLPKAPTTEEATRNAKSGTGRPAPDRPPSARVEPPSSRYVDYTEGDVFRISVPSNWREMSSSSSVTFAPDAAVGQAGGENVFTHGVQAGVSRNESHDVQTAAEELVASLSRGNPNLRRASGYSRTSIGGRRGLQATLENYSDATGQREVIQLAATTLRGGSLFYLLGVVPQNEFRDYQSTFQRIFSSVRLND
jgi:Zn-dependent protease with chaperone function